jgi:tetratricopeptide (TPR) repeat protein
MNVPSHPQACPSPAGPPSSGQKLLVSFLLVAATLATFLPAVHCGFVNFDDTGYIVNNPHVREGLTAGSIAWAFTNTKFCLWIPLTWLSYMFDVHFHGLDPAGHHLTNVLLHCANVVLLFLLLARMTGAPWRSAVVAGLFALHPLRVESVAWVAERKDVLSTFFALLALRAYAIYAEAPRVSRYAVVVLWLALGLMAKPMLVTLPFVLLLLDYWPLRRIGSAPTSGPAASPRSRAMGLLLEKLPLVALAVGMAVLAIVVAQRGGAIETSRSLDVRLANALVSYVRYLGKTFWPARLTSFYPFPDAWPWWQVAGGALLLGVLGVSALLVRRRCPYVTVGWLWFVGGLVPAIGLIQAGNQAMADRFTYVPMMGLLVAIVWGAHEILGRTPARASALAVVAVLVLAVLGTLSRRQVAYWKDSRTLFAHAVEVTPDNWVAHNNLGNALATEGRPEEAIAHFDEALRLQPSYADAQFGLGVALAAQGKFDEAIAQYERALELDPTHVQAHNNFGVILLARNDVEGALDQFIAAVRLEPDVGPPLANLRLALTRLGYAEETISAYVRSFRGAPARVDADLARPGGQEYRRELSRWFMANQAGVVQQCIESGSNSEPAPFELYLTLRGDGAPAEVFSSPPTPIGACMATRLAGDRLPVPPFAPFHTNMRMNFQGSQASAPSQPPNA